MGHKVFRSTGVKKCGMLLVIDFYTVVSKMTFTPRLETMFLERKLMLLTPFYVLCNFNQVYNYRAI